MSNSVFTNNLRLEEIASGERSGTWGTATNTNISLITDAFAFGTEAITTNATAHSTNMEDADETQTGAPRSMYLKYTGTLNATCTVTLGPNSVSKVWIIENATSGSQILTIKQGTGSSVNIPNGSVKVVYSDGGGTGANVVDAFTDLDVAGTFAVAGNTTVGGTFTSTGAVTANAGVSIDNITIDGTEIDLSSGDLTLDVAGDIVLNSDDGIIFLKDDTATFGSLNNNSGNLIIKSGTTTAATFSGANVTLAGTVVTGGLTTLGGNLVIPNAGNIGSVGDTDAISISSSGVVTLTQNLIIPDGGNIGSASDTDAIAISSGGGVTMSQIPIFSAGINVSGGSIAGSLSSTTQGNITATGALNSGSITSGFGAIDNGSSAITTTGTITGGTITTSGTVNFGSLSDGTITITAFVDEDDMASDSATLVPTQQSVKAYIASVTGGGGSTLTIQNEGSSLSTGAGTINFTGGGVVASGSGATKTITISGGIKTIGTDNIAFGSNALDSINHGSINYNIAIGADVLTTLTAHASGNVAVGHEAMEYFNGIGTNVALGYRALKGQTVDFDSSSVTHQPDGVIAIGGSAAYNALSSNDSIAIGSSAFYYSRGDYSIAIGTQSQYGGQFGGSLTNVINSNGDYNISLGFKSMYSIYQGDDNIALGRNAAYSLSTANTSIAIGKNSLYSCVGSDDNIAIGEDASYSCTSSQNIAIGVQANKGNSSGNTSTGCVSIGFRTQYQTTGATRNTNVGYLAMGECTSGSYNSAFGSHALEGVTTGASNVGIGGDAGGRISTGDYNIGVGYEALGSTQSGNITGDLNIGIGASPLKKLTSGTENIAIGQESLSQTDTGSYNVAMGRLAGSYTTSGNKNTFIGFQAGYQNVSGSFNTCIGSDAAITGATDTSNQFVLGGSTVNDLRCNDQSIAALSDERDKTNIIDSPFGLDFINSTRPVQFKWDRRNADEDDIKNGKTRLGFIAQELQGAMPNKENEILDLVLEVDPEKLEAKYGNLIPILTKAIQQLSDKNDALEARIKLLEG